ncbi:type II secretion system protein N [Microbulbifer sediminum]|uniref:type II secretion system protein N n=1 Tax=Microbulbifer sediminum TaxID=2904250 RepID=UPI001F2DB5DC|nr:type II secretion system protein N [Microbulbifer sediminum]
MTAVSRVFSAFRDRFAHAEGRKPFPRSTAASAAVAAGWLLLNATAYGALIIPSSPEESLLAPRQAAPSTVARTTRLPATQFFGDAAVEQGREEPDLDLANIPITQLNLVLSGVLDSSRKERASALVAERGKPAERVYVGDALPGGAKLHSVAVDHIVLQRGGQMEKLTYPDVDGQPSVSRRNYATGSARASSASVRSRGSVNNADQSRASVRERLEELRRLAKERRAERQSQ